MKVDYSRIFPKDFFSKETVPYLCIVLLDCITIVSSGVLSLYLIEGGVGVISDFWGCVKMWIAFLPFFIIFMHLFKTYRGIRVTSALMDFLRISMALVLGGGMIKIAFWLFPYEMMPFWPSAVMILCTVAISVAAMWIYRMLGKYVYKGRENEKTAYAFFHPFAKGNYADVSLGEHKKINLCLAHMSEDGQELKYVKEAFDTNWVVPLGPNVNAFEKDLEKFVNGGSGTFKNVVALSAGTSAIHLALKACGVCPGDEVIVQSFTFCASANPVVYLGAVPVFVDSEPDTWNMDPNLLEKAVLDRIQKTGRKPKAIVPVALYGMPYNVDRIMAVSAKYDIPVIEDAAEGLGSRWKGRVLGSFGKFGVMSFNGNKMITTSGGGALICQSEESKKNIMWYATQAREAYPYYQHEAIGYNYRLSNVCAGIGRGQMTVLDDHIAHHKHVQKLYEQLLKDVPGVKVHCQPKNDAYDSNYWLCAITLDPALKVQGQENAYKIAVTGAVGGAAGVIRMTDSATTDCQPNENVEAMRIFLDKAQIEARPVWKPMHLQPVFKIAPAYVNGVSESIFKVGLCLPAGPCVTDEDVHYIVSKIKESIA